MMMMIAKKKGNRNRPSTLYILFRPFYHGAIIKVVAVLDSGSNGPGLSPGRDSCVVFLGKTIFFQSHRGEQMGTGEGSPAMDYHLIQRVGVGIRN